MKAIFAKPERGSKAHGSACGKPGKRLARIVAAGLALALLGVVSGCGSNADNIPSASNCTPSNTFSIEVSNTPTLPPATASPTVSPSPTPTPVPEVSTSPTPSPKVSASLKPSLPAKYAGLEILSVTSPVAPDGHATLSARGKPGVKYKISVIYRSGPSSASGLYAKTADENGLVSWTWHVGPNTGEGKWKIVISGGGEKKSTHFTVKK